MYDDILLSVTKPGRYVGNEYNAVKKNPQAARVKFALCFPDTYEVGMSHLGARIIYSILNGRKDVLCERVFSPWVDMGEILRKRDIQLASLENGIPLREFDVVGFSLSYELSYTNVLNMLELSRIPLLRRQRDEKDPIVIAGGLCCLNPEPMSDFFDAFLIGDGEEAVIEIVDAYLRTRDERRKTKDEILKELAQVEGVYVPGISAKVRRRIVENLDDAPYPTDFVVPNVEVIHDRVAVEIMRGCPFNCNFCQARAGYYPKRLRSAENVLRLAAGGIKKTGCDEVSLLSLSSANHPQILEIMEKLSRIFEDSGVSIALPSLRVDRVTKELPALLARTKKTGLTIAPEAGSERLRKAINKTIDIDELYKAFRCALECSWRRIKLYFMIGLPSEEYSDLDGIADIVGGLQREKQRLRVSCDITLSVSAFIPKPHTAFGRMSMDTAQRIKDKQSYLLTKLNKRNLKVNFHDEKQSFLECVLSRGDGNLGKVIYAAYKNGAKFDAWSDQFKFDVWMEAFASNSIDPAYYANRKVGDTENLPWDFVDVRNN